MTYQHPDEGWVLQGRLFQCPDICYKNHCVTTLIQVCHQLHCDIPRTNNLNCYKFRISLYMLQLSGAVFCQLITELVSASDQ